MHRVSLLVFVTVYALPFSNETVVCKRLRGNDMWASNFIRGRVAEENPIPARVCNQQRGCESQRR